MLFSGFQLNFTTPRFGLAGSLDNTVMIWNVATLAQEKDAPDAQTQQMHEM